MDGSPTFQPRSERARPAALGAGDRSAPVTGAYQRFLVEPGVENEFYAAKALLQRARWTAGERRRLAGVAGAAEVEAGHLGRAHDEDQRRRFSFAAGSTVALGLAAVDAIPAYLGAQAFGLDLWTTIGITAVLVAALAAAMWAVTHYTAGWRRWLVSSALGAGLAVIGALRWWFLVVTATEATAALLQAVGLTIFTTLLVWLGVVVLGFTKARRVSAAERRARSLRRQAERADATEAELSRRAEAAMRELVARAQVFSSRDLADQDSRTRFLDHVRGEVES
jgi:hypothetical protein